MHEYVCGLRGMLQDVRIALRSAKCTQRVRMRMLYQMLQ